MSTNHRTEPSITNISLQEARVVFERMREFTELTPEFNSRRTQMTSMGQSPESRLQSDFQKVILQRLTAENLSFRFADRPALLKNASFTVLRGEIVGIVGETGSGKSGLLQQF